MRFTLQDVARGGRQDPLERVSLKLGFCVRLYGHFWVLDFSCVKAEDSVDRSRVGSTVVDDSTD